MSLDVGAKAPQFRLKSSTEEEISLSDYIGDSPTVVLFFPLAFSPVCTNELVAVRDDYRSYEKLGARVVGVSVDSQFTLRAWADQLELQFPLLSDFNKETARAYGALEDDYFGMKGVSKRAAFVIDADGKVVYRWITDDDSVLPDFEAIKSAVKEAST